MTQEYQDITTIGPEGLQGLKGLNFKDMSPEELLLSILNYSPTTVELLLYLPILLGSSFEVNTGQNVGSSRFDNPYYTEGQLDLISDIRAKNQPGIAKLAAGFGKMAVTAGTTFISNLIGGMLGIGQGLYNIFDNDPKTTWAQALWDNAVNTAMADVQEWAEKVMPNYYRDWELQAPWYQTIGTANFWGDKLIKNAGFMIGTAGAMAVSGGIMGGITKGLQLPGLLSKGANLVTKATTLFLSSSGEAAIESLQANRDNAKRIKSDIQLKSKQGTELAMMMHEDRMRKGMNFELSMALYNKDIEKLKSDLDLYRQAALEKNIDATNSIYATQLGVLMLTNAITFSSFLRGGYKNGSLFSNIIQRKVGDNLNPTNIEFLKGLGKGTASMSLKEGAGKTGAKMAGMWLIDSASEGTQEGLQGLINTGETMYLDSQLYSLKNSVDENGNYKLPALRNVTSLMDYSFNGDNMKEITDRASAYRKALKELFGSIEAPGWEEVFIGALTAGIGVPTLGPKHSINSLGKTSTKLGFTWAGGLREAYENTFGELKRLEEQLLILNNYIQSPETQRKFEHASTAFGVNWALQMALENGDIQSYKNGEVASIANDALFFKEFGLMDMYMSLWNDISEIVTDEDVEEFKNATRDSMTGKTPLDGKSSDEIKTMYRNKAQSYKNKINNVIESYDKWHDKLKKTFKDTPQYVEIISREAAFKEALLKDTYKRINELELEVTSKLESLTSGEIQDYDLSIKSLKKQVIKIKEYLNNLSKNPSKITEDLEKQLKASQLYHNRANAEFIEERIKNATSLKDVYQIYLTTDESIRDAVFSKLETEGSPEVKDYIRQLNEDMLELSVITSEIDNASIPDDIKGFYKNIVYRAIQNWAENISTPKRSVEEQVKDLERDVENQILDLQEDYSESSLYLYLNNLLSIIRNLTAFIDIIKATRGATTPTPPPVVPEPAESEEKLEGEVLDEDELYENTGENILRKLELYLSDFIDNNYATEPKNKILDNIYKFESSEGHIIGNIKQNLEKNKDSLFGDINEDFWETQLKDIIDSILNEFKNTYKSEVGESLNVTEDEASSEVLDNPKLEDIDKSNNSESSINDYLKGSLFNLYNVSDLKNHKLSVYSPNSDLAFIQNTLDFLSKYLKRDATVFYAKNCVEGREDEKIIYLVVNKDDFINLPKDTKFENIVEQGGKEYIIIGTLGYNNTNKDQQASWNKIAEKVFNGEHNTDPYVLTDDISNKVKDITPGYIIYNEGSNTGEKFTPITELDIEYLGGVSNLKFGVQLDSEHRKINKKPGEIFHEPTNALSGQVFLYVPTARPNEYIPILVRNAYSINESSPDYTKMVKFISDKLDTILKSSEPATTKIKEFKKLFNFFLLAENNYIAANESGVINGVLHGKVQYLGNFNTSNLEELKNKIIEFLFSEKYLNARFKINKEILKNNPLIYLDLGLLKINAQVKVRGSQLYVYSTNDLGIAKETTKEKSSTTTSTYSKNKKESTLHLNNRTYKKVENPDGSTFYYLMSKKGKAHKLDPKTLIDVENIFILNENLEDFSFVKLNDRMDPVYRIGDNLYGYNSRKSFYVITKEDPFYSIIIKEFDEMEKAQTEESMKKIEEVIIKTIEEAELNTTSLLEAEPVLDIEDLIKVYNEQTEPTEGDSLTDLGFSMVDENILENLTENNLVDSEKITNFAEYMLQAIIDGNMELMSILDKIPGDTPQEKGETLIADGFTSFNNTEDFKEKIYCRYGK